MANFIRKNLTNNLVLVLLVMSLAPLVLIASIGFQMTEQMRSDFLNELAGQFDEKVFRLDASIEQRIFEMDVLSHQVLFQELVSDLPNVQVQDIHDELSTRYLDYAERTTYVDTLLEVKVFDNDGMELFSLYDTHLGSDYSTESIDAITDIHIFFDFDEKFGRIIKAEAPIMSKDNLQRLGMLLFVTDMKNFDSILLDRSGLKETGEAYFVNPEKIMASESRFIEDAAFNQEADTFGVRQCLENNSEVRGDLYPDYRGEPIIGYSKCMLEHGVVLLVEADVQEMESPLDLFHNQFLGVLIVTGVATFFISISMGHRISRKINEIDTKTLFLNNLTHELKTPLVPIQGNAEMLKNPKMGELNEMQRESVDEIHKYGTSLLSTVDNFIKLQKITESKPELHVEKINLDELIEIISKIPTKDSIEIKISFDNGLLVNADKSELIWIITELIKNTTDFLPEQNGKIEISAKGQNENVIVSVKDNGSGIPKEKQKDIFKPFVKVDMSQSRTHGGVGLGLAIIKGLVKVMKGKIWVESEEGKGANFLFTIPKAG
jgi:signal transduction histidine kinase